MTMAKILVVDDRAVNRQLLVTLLGYAQHQVSEATDGAEALQRTRAEHPDLIITDIVMPTMDGFEFVQRLRADASIAHIPVIFYTATYIEGEARALARACGVPYVITKPADPQKILDTVAMALGSQATSAPAHRPGDGKPVPADLLADKLIEKSRELEAATLRLAALIEVGLELSAHRDPELLLQTCCHAARKIIGAKYSAVAIFDDERKSLRYLLRSGMDPGTAARMGKPDWTKGIISEVLSQRRSRRLREIADDPGLFDLALGHPEIHNLLDVPLQSPHDILGWLSLSNKLGAEEFSEEDERIALTLAAQIAVSYENARLSDELSEHSARLQTEVAERTRAQEAAQATREIWELTFDSVPDPIVVISEECRIVQANHAVSTVTGLAPEKIIGRHCYEVLHGLAEARVDCPHQEVLRNGVEARGEIYEPWLGKFFATTAAPIKGADGALRGCVHVLRDVTEQRKAAEALRESEERFRHLAENIGEVFYIMGPEGESIIYVSPAYEDVWGRKCAELAANPLAWTESIHPDDRQRVAAYYTQKVRDKEAFQIEYRIVRPDGSIRLIWNRTFPVKDDKGRLVRFVGIAEDVTKRKDLEVQLIQAQKMEAVGRLAGGVAHDFNNLLTIILGRGQLVQEKLTPEDANRGSVEEILKAGDRAAGLTRQLLAFSRKQVMQARVLDLNLLVTDLSKLLRRMIGEDVELSTALSKDIGPVQADPGQIEQVMMNLAVNARDAMPRGGRLTIETANVDLDETYAASHLDLPPGPYTMLAVTDTGTGIADDIKSHIFEPFFTTKEQGRGTGLGLATVYGIVKQSGGYVWVYSEVGKGSTFKVYLPRVDRPPDAAVPRLAAMPAPGGKETILLVEDETPLRALVAEILRSKGYHVLEAENGENALGLAKEHRGPTHLLLTDVVMPGMSGRELAEKLSQFLPNAKILYMSGYTDDSIVRHGVLATGTAFIQKPFSPDSIARKVREMLDAPKSKM
jgi:PAS domain S-box-containing protein